jgi:AraC-like DNA-binding protein
MNKGVSYMSVQTMESMVKWLDNNVMENPTLEGMSSYVGYSPYYCSTKFREYTGITYKLYLAKCRLNAAANLLIMTDYKIIEIAFKCGYSSSESLSRAFLKVHQCTPTRYRKAYIGL